MKAKNAQRELLSRSDDKTREKSESFFKMGKGQYSQHDEFIGIRMADVRGVAKDYQNLSFAEVKILLQSKIHEDRICGLLILVLKMKSTVKKQDTSKAREIAQFYLKHKEHVNNWDLVDVSAHYILGQYILLYPKESEILYELAQSKSLWDRRIAIVSQWLMIREGEYSHVLPLAKILLSDKQDLMHKAVGWMLREYWKKCPPVVENFLEDNYQEIPRTTLRYAIEKIENNQRKRILSGDFSK